MVCEYCKIKEIPKRAERFCSLECYHAWRGTPSAGTKELNQKISKAHKGKKLTEEHKLKLTESLTKSHLEKDFGFKKGYHPWNIGIVGVCVAWNKDTKGICKPNSGSFKKGHKISEEDLRKITIASTGRRHSEKTKEKLRKYFSGKKRPDISGDLAPTKRPEVKQKLRLANLGPKNPNWQGGLTEHKYAPSFNKELRNKIRIRDKFVCFICDKSQEENKKKLAVHHIDYNKNNSNEDNLVSLCKSCHSIVNFDRDYWEIYLKGELQWQI